MTTFTFTPTPQAPFQFQPSLDNQTYSVVITWNVTGQRWYLQLYDLSGNLIVTRPLISSPPARNLQSLSWSRGTVTATATAQHGFRLGSTIAVTLAGCSPTQYNGVVLAHVTGPNTFTYPLSADPGNATLFGTVGYEIDLLGGYFASRMVYRETSRQFEVTP